MPMSSKSLSQAKAEFFRILGHPARIRVLELLSERDHAVHELLAELEIEPSNLSHQLAALRRTGLVVQHREHGQVVYAIAAPEIKELLAVARVVLREVVNERIGLSRELEVSTS